MSGVHGFNVPAMPQYMNETPRISKSVLHPFGRISSLWFSMTSTVHEPMPTPQLAARHLFAGGRHGARQANHAETRLQNVRFPAGDLANFPFLEHRRASFR